MKKITAALTIIFLFFFITSIYSQSKGITKEKKDNMILESLGASSGSNLYLTFMMIGTLGDSYENKSMSGEDVVKNTRVVISQSRVIQKYFQKLLDSEAFDPQDKPFAQKIIYTYLLLQKEGDALIQYIQAENEKDKKRHSKEFHNYRSLAQEQISDLLGLD